MTTENLTRNTEMFSVPRHTLENILKDGSCKPEVYASFRQAYEDIRALLDHPATQPHADPSPLDVARSDFASDMDDLRADILAKTMAENERLISQLAELEKLHGGELGLPMEGWPAYHKRKMESLRDLTTGHYERKLAGRDALLREVVDSGALFLEDHQPSGSTIDLHERCEAVLSASTEPSSNLCAEGAHEFVPFQDNCVKCREPYQAAPVPKVDPAALRVAMENLAVRTTYGVDQPPEVVLNGTGLRVHYSGMKWYHEHLVNDRWEALTVDEFDALLTEALAKA